jgi:hypothetical protein
MRNNTEIEASTAYMFEGADIACQLIAATLQASAVTEWDGSQLVASSGNLSYKVTFSDSTYLPTSMCSTDASGGVSLTSMATVRKVATASLADKTKTVAVIVN